MLERLPKHIGEKANQDVRLDAPRLVMPDRTDREIGLVDTERRLGLGELDVRVRTYEPEVLL